MFLTVEPKLFIAAVTAATAVIGSRLSIPILAFVNIRAHDNVLTITGTNIDMESAASCTASVSQQGHTNVPALDLKAFASRIPAGALITIELADTRLKLSAGRFSVVLPVNDDMYPIMADKGDMVEVIGAHDALALCLPFCSDDETRYYLRGVFLDDEFAVATNGNILRTAVIDSGPGSIIPVDAIPHIIKAGGRLYAGANGWRCESEGRRLTGKVIDGTFPDWRRILPGAGDPIYTVDADALAAAVDAATLGNASRVLLDGRGDHIVLTGEGYDRSKAAARTECDAQTGDRATGVSRAYIATVMSSFAGSVVDISQTTDGDAMRITAPGRDGLAVLMPMRMAGTR